MEWATSDPYHSQPQSIIALWLVPITRPHRSTTYVDAAYCYRPSSVVCHSSEPCKNGWTDRDAVWDLDSGGPKEACIRWGANLAPPSVHHWTAYVRRRCDLLSNYFDDLYWLVTEARVCEHLAEGRYLIANTWPRVESPARPNDYCTTSPVPSQPVHLLRLHISTSRCAHRSRQIHFHVLSRASVAPRPTGNWRQRQRVRVIFCHWIDVKPARAHALLLIICHRFSMPSFRRRRPL